MNGEKKTHTQTITIQQPKSNQKKKTYKAETYGDDNNNK